MKENKKICLIGIGEFGLDTIKHLYDVNAIADLYFVHLNEIEKTTYHIYKEENITLLELEEVKAYEKNGISDITGRYSHVLTVSDINSLDSIIVARRLAIHAEHSGVPVMHVVPEIEFTDSRSMTICSLLGRNATVLTVNRKRTDTSSEKDGFIEAVRKTLNALYNQSRPERIRKNLADFIN